MADRPTLEGEISFQAPGAAEPGKTWYKIIGKLESTPLIALHGGPGTGYEYMDPLIDLYDKHGIPIIFYDQVGCGRSTHYRERMGDGSFWTFDLFIEELDNLVDHLELRQKGFYILGQSWGGMLGAAYATRCPRGLKKLILAGSPASIPLYAKAANYLLSQLPPDVRDTLQECIEKGDFESPEYQAASLVFYKRHFCRIYPFPEPIQIGFKNLEDDPTAYLTMQGPSEFVINGTFKDWEGWKGAHNIKAETLLLNGRYDEAMDSCIEPWFKTIPKVKWAILENSAHMTHWEERERFMQLCGAFLTDSLNK
ncbi:proline iminopeptidase [Hypoxylon rubiginosum]|uniref:Proline iminopeptidase n=1 Tax=Hypoxylon rubiginosum TaxID=110542 RepID=A0ACB9YQJ5_9PEZI|nr:proline iminopeptidase [Hypoxylon rubiginosum]